MICVLLVLLGLIHKIVSLIMQNLIRQNLKGPIHRELILLLLVQKIRIFRLKNSVSCNRKCRFFSHIHDIYDAKVHDLERNEVSGDICYTGEVACY